MNEAANNMLPYIHYNTGCTVLRMQLNDICAIIVCLMYLRHIVK